VRWFVYKLTVRSLVWLQINGALVWLQINGALVCL